MQVQGLDQVLVQEPMAMATERGTMVLGLELVLEKELASVQVLDQEWELAQADGCQYQVEERMVDSAE